MCIPGWREFAKGTQAAKIFSRKIGRLIWRQGWIARYQANFHSTSTKYVSLIELKYLNLDFSIIASLFRFYFFFFNISIFNFLTSNFGFRKTNECTSIFREYLQGARRWHSLLRYFYHVDERIDGLGDLLVPYRRDSRGVPWKIQRTGDEQQRLASGALQQSSWTAARSMCERHWNVPGHGPQLHSIPSPHGFGDIAREWKTRLL